MALAQRSSFLVSARTTLAKPFRRSITRTFCSSQADSIKQTVNGNKVVIYSKTYCPYCTEVKGLMGKLQVSAKVLELDTMGDEGAQIQSTLQTITGCRTVPQVFVGGKFIGGCNDTVAAYKAGKLKQVFQEAGVSSSL